MKFQIAAMTVGDILDRGLKMLLANLPAFYLINLMVLWPIISCSRSPAHEWPRRRRFVRIPHY